MSDVEDARRVAAQLDLPHYVFNFAEEFDPRVVEPYVESYAAGRTPNPCIECNRSIKWGRLYERARAMGFDTLATGHHARRTTAADGTPELRRGADAAKDQSYVGPATRVRPARGHGAAGRRDAKADVHAHAARLGLRTATKAESMDVCFITRGGRTSFLDARVPATPGRIVDTDGTEVGAHEGVHAFTVGQRHGLAVKAGVRRYVVDVDAAETATVTIGGPEDLTRSGVHLTAVTTTGAPVTTGTRIDAQVRAHGAPHPARGGAIRGVGRAPASGGPGADGRALRRRPSARRRHRGLTESVSRAGRAGGAGRHARADRAGAVGVTG